MERFLFKAINHRIICGSEDLRSFLCDIDFAFDERKRQSENYLTLTGQNQTYTSLVYSTVSSALTIASDKLSNYVWQNSAIKRKTSFGTLTPAADDELNRFIGQETYL